MTGPRIVVRTLTQGESRCRPVPDCPLKSGCARYASPIGTSPVGNWRHAVTRDANGVTTCSYHIGARVDEASIEHPRPPVKPWPTSSE